MTRLLHVSLLHAAILAIICASSAQSSAQVLLANPGFEAPITSDGPPYVGFWEAFDGGTGASATNSNMQPRNGAMHVDLTITSSDNNFAGIFQDVPAVVGQKVAWSVWAKRTSTLDLDVEMRIEWRNSASNTEISRTPNFDPSAAITFNYSNFSLLSTVPAGVDLARLLFRIQTFSGGAGNTGTVYLDDARFTVFPTGDFDQNGVEDGFDFLAWQRGFGRNNAKVIDGDGDGDADVDGNDFAIWKNTFGSALPASVSVPEPFCSSLLLTFAAMATIAMRCSRSK